MIGVRVQRHARLMGAPESATARDPISAGLSEVLKQYGRARERDRFKAHPLRTVMTELSTAIGRLECTSRLQVRWSVGQGNWATIPWVALLDPGVTDRVSRGVYAIFLFRADLSGVYLTLNQGTTEMGSGAGVADELRARAHALRAACGALPKHGFLLDHSIDLRSTTAIARGYEHATVAHKLYEVGKVPRDGVLQDDIAVVCDAYGRVRGSNGAG